MPRLLRRLLLILLIAVVVVAGIGLAAFTWVAYWPLEGDFEDMTRLVPADVDFVVRGSWQDIKETGWLQANVLEDPLVPPALLMGLMGPSQDAPPRDAATTTEDFKALLERQLRLLRDIEDQVNSQIPTDLVTFSVEGDVIPEEVVAAGKFCEGLNPGVDVPRWYEFVLLTRVSWKPKLAVAALQRGFIRDAAGPNAKIEEVEDEVYRVIVPNIPVTSKRARTCGPDQVRPPENTFYLSRVNDVIVFSNALGLTRSVRELGEFPDSGRGYVDRPHVDLSARTGGAVASVDVQPLQNYLQQTLERTGSPVTILQRYLTIPSLNRLNGYLQLPSHDQIRAHASIRYKQGELGSGVDDVYALAPTSPQEGIAALVPQRDTFAALLLRTPALQLLDGIYEDVLSPGDRRLWRENLRKMGGYSDIEEFFREFASKLGDTAGIAIGRISDVYDDRDYPSFYHDPEEFWDPTVPAIAMIVRLNDDTTPDELDAYLAKRVPLLGGDPELERAVHNGLEYTKVRLQAEIGDYRDISPAWILVQDHFIFSSNEHYFRRVLDTLKDPEKHPPLAQSETFRAAMGELPEEVHVALFVDLERLFHVPPSTAKGDQPRGFLWDRRNMWIQDNRSPRDAAVEYRNARSLEIRKDQGGRALSNQQLFELEEEVDRIVQAHISHYDKFLEEYRRYLEGFGRLRALGVGIAARREHLDADLAVLFQSPQVEAGESAE